MTPPGKKSLLVEHAAGRLLEAALFSGMGLFLLAGILVGSRHWAGALEKSLPFAAICGLGVGLGAAAAALRSLESRLNPGRFTFRGRLIFSGCITATTLIFGLAITSSDTPAAGQAFFWLALLAEETWGWSQLLSPRKGFKILRRIDPSPIVTCPTPHKRPSIPFLDYEQAETIPGSDIMQSLTRRISPAGNGEELAGWVRMPVAAGQRNGNVHVAFCPPFSRVPELTVEQADGPEARIKTAQLLPYGVRLDLKLTTAASQPDSVLVYFSAKTAKETDS
jgi:hypothetical protein